MLVSIGRGCPVRYQIDRYVGDKAAGPTNLFDFVLSDLASVVKILTTTDFDSLFNASTMIVADPPSILPNDHSEVTNTVLSRFISLHDVEKPVRETSVAELIETFRRRRDRFVELIRTANKEPIYFVHWTDEAAVDDYRRLMLEFRDAVTLHNPECNFRVFCLLDTEATVADPPDFVRQLRIPYRSPADPNDWQKNYYDWDEIWTRLM